MNTKVLENILKDANIKLSSNQISDIKVYINELKIWNKKCNLTSFKKDEDIFINLFIDSFTLIPYVKLQCRLLDVGTGAGFPGLALKICFENLNLDLLDSSKKKCAFLNHMKNLLMLKDTNIFWGRAEDFGRKPDFREKYDIVCSRAVAKMNELVELGMPFVKINGVFLALKGKDEQEIKESKKVVELLGGNIEKIEKIKLPFFKEIRHIVVIRKKRLTHMEYPRRDGIPKKHPLSRE
ncbi:MAG: 16S rRNA (guanine(527)-N(7))-methyltransferase RsmG [Candidatus Firestonebacteria bacterium]